MPNCKICNHESNVKYINTPYWMCNNCTLWFQDPKPKKLYEANHEKDAEGNFTGHLMSVHEKSINASLAKSLSSHIVNNKKTALDIGSKYPYLSHCLKNNGFYAWGMDNIEIVPKYSLELDVPMIMKDFENTSVEDILEICKEESFQLITLIHVFEHFYEPILALEKLRKLISDDGLLFIRLPDYSVSGFERHLTVGHYTIHPYYHTLDSILELLVKTRNLFKVSKTYPLEGSGQRDIFLKPIKNKHKIFAGLIVKNEERDLPKCLKSIESVIDGVVVIDTGSTDNTYEIAINTINKPIIFKQFLEASKLIDNDWKICDFSKARNEFIKEINNRADYCFWIDADDELLNPNELNRSLYLDEFSVFGLQIRNGCSDPFVHHRIWKTKLGVLFEGRCHEYPTIGGYPANILKNVFINHDATPQENSENSNDRNLRILEEDFKDNPNNLRTAFYLANTHKDGERYLEAIPYYQIRINLGIGYRDEWLLAYLNKARCERAIGKINEAKSTLLEACSKEPSWAEFWMELAYISSDQSKNYDAIGFALQAYNKPIPPTNLWREKNKYTDQPARAIAHAYNNLNEKSKALEWAHKAKKLIGEKDLDWDQFILRLNINKKIAINRPGAIGDILMILNLIPYLKAKYTNHELHFYCNEIIGNELHDLMIEAGIDEVRDSSEFLPSNIYEHWFNLIGYPINEGYPNVLMKKHLIEYFAAELGLEEVINPLPSLCLSKPNKIPNLPDKYATIQVKTGWSKYKEWPIKNWELLLKEFPNIPFYQIGTEDHPKIKYANHSLIGQNLNTSIAAIANSNLHIGLDSFANHLTHYAWDDKKQITKVPAIILWGSTQVLASGYSHNKNISLGLPCQPCFKEDPKISKMNNGVCQNPHNQDYNNPKHACMHNITVQQVKREIENVWYDKKYLKMI